MRLKLPRLDLLDPHEQQPIFFAPLDSSLLVTGPPGTGKTVLAVYRLQKYIEARGRNAQCKMLVYNKTLHEYIKEGLRRHSIEASATTWHSWIWRFYRNLTGHPPPQAGNYTYNWQQILTEIANQIDRIQQFTYIIDEGQDMPPEFYYFIREISTHLMVFADQNQRITNDNCNINTIRLNAGFEADECIRVTRNYRNTRMIAEVASCFFTGSPDEKPALPPENARGPKPEYHVMSTEEQYNHIVTYCRNNQRREIGIFLPTAAMARNMYRRLYREESLQNRIEILFSGIKNIKCKSCDQLHPMFLNNARRLVCVWNANHEQGPPAGKMESPALREGSNIISILCYPSAKGVEFDTVFLPLLSPGWHTNDTPANRMLFYVLLARPRSELRLLSEQPIEQIPVLGNNISRNLIGPDEENLNF